MTSVVLNGNTYDSSQFPGYGYNQQLYGDVLFPNSIFRDMLAQLAASPVITGGALAPTTSGAVPVANGTNWVLSTAFASTVKFTAATGFVIGTDPGGVQLLRVGGSATFSGAVALQGGVYNTVGGAKFVNFASNATNMFSGTSGFNINNATDTANLLALTNAGALSIAGGLTFAAGVVASQQGQTGFSPTFGLFGWAKTGTTDDYTVFSTTGAYVFHVPTGTSNVNFAGSIIVGTDPGSSAVGRFGGAVIASGGIQSSGASSGFTFNDRTTSSQLWVFFANSNYLQFTDGTRNAFLLGYTSLDNGNYYRAGNHHIQDTTGANTFALINSGGAVWGVDPGGSDFQRIGGAVTASGGFRSKNGLTSMATGTNTTLFATTVPGRYTVSWYLAGSGVTYMGTAEVVFDGTTALIATSTAGANTASALSGTNFQVRQASGSTQSMSWSYAIKPA